MKKFFVFAFLAIFSISFMAFNPENAVFALEDCKMVIIIDDFGGYDQSGVETMLSIDAPLTCAVIPESDNTANNAKSILEAGKEVIVHMPMQAHVNIPLNWYGTFFISSGESKSSTYEKLDRAFKSVEGAKGFNIHIGSGVCQNKETIGYIYDYATEHNLPFVDSRTHMNTVCDKVAKEKGYKYLGRDEFLEPEGDRSYNGVCKHLSVGMQVAKEKGLSIVIGHVGSHGGENTARAIKDMIPKIKEMGIKIVPLSEIYK